MKNRYYIDTISILVILINIIRYRYGIDASGIEAEPALRREGHEGGEAPQEVYYQQSTRDRVRSIVPFKLAKTMILREYLQLR